MPNGVDINTNYNVQMKCVFFQHKDSPLMHNGSNTDTNYNVEMKWASSVGSSSLQDETQGCLDLWHTSRPKYFGQDANLKCSHGYWWD